MLDPLDTRKYLPIGEVRCKQCSHLDTTSRTKCPPCFIDRNGETPFKDSSWTDCLKGVRPGTQARSPGSQLIARLPGQISCPLGEASLLVLDPYSHGIAKVQGPCCNLCSPCRQLSLRSTLGQEPDASLKGMQSLGNEQFCAGTKSITTCIDCLSPGLEYPVDEELQSSLPVVELPLQVLCVGHECHDRLGWRRSPVVRDEFSNGCIRFVPDGHRARIGYIHC